MRKHRIRLANSLRLRVLFLTSIVWNGGGDLGKEPYKRISLAITVISIVLIVSGVLQLLGWMEV